MSLVKQKKLLVGETGQVLVTVILVIVIALTVGLSLASRTITNSRSAAEEAESQKALAAAEAGIERTIQGHLSITTPVDMGNSSKFKTEVQPLSAAEFLLNGGIPISKDEGTDVWFQNHDPTTGDLIGGSFEEPDHLALYWGTTANSCSGDAPAAIQAIIVAVDSSGTIKTYRYAYDPCSSRGNNFTATTTGAYSIGALTFRNKSPDGDLASDVPIGENIIFIRVVPLYKDSVIGITNGTTSLPLQGYRIESTGTSGEANRKIRVFNGWPQTYLPYLSYGLFVAEGN